LSLGTSLAKDATMVRGSAWGVFGLGAIVSSTWVACIDKGQSPVSDAGPEPAVLDASPPPPPSDASRDATTLVPESGTDASTDVTPPPVLHEVGGHVSYGGDVAGATVSLLAPYAATTTTNATGNFVFFLPEGRTAILKVTPPAGSDALPMIRAMVIKANLRPREYYLVGRDERLAAQALGITLDSSKAIVEVDFRNATRGGYSAQLKSGTSTIVPGFGVALDGDGMPVASTSTVTGGQGSTLFLGNLTPATFSVTPSSPADAGAACLPCDAPELPMEANVVTWVDFECGVAKCE
jgi:hypothetical protein